MKEKEIIILGVDNEEKSIIFIQLFKAQPGISSAWFNKSLGILTLCYDPDLVDPDFFNDMSEFLGCRLILDKKEVEFYGVQMHKRRFLERIMVGELLVFGILLIYILLGLIDGTGNEPEIYVCLVSVLILMGFTKWKKNKVLFACPVSIAERQEIKERIPQQVNPSLVELTVEERGVY